LGYRATADYDRPRPAPAWREALTSWRSWVAWSTESIVAYGLTVFVLARAAATLAIVLTALANALARPGG
jgi:hypothetical protein